MGKLEAVERGEIKRLIITMPPRHFKSQTATAHFSPWYIGRNPDKRVIGTSYGASLVSGFSRQARELTEQYGPEIFGITVNPRSASTEKWDVMRIDEKDPTKLRPARGGMAAVGVGGSLTGKGAHVLLIDDPHKDREEAESQVMRDKVWNWYTSTAYTRLESDGAIIVIQTRWHKDDLAGRLLKAMDTDDEYAESWEVVDFPALAETEDDLGRKPGDALWPEGGFDAKRLRQIRVAIGTKDFLSLYQQKPQDNEGGAFKAHWFKWYTSSDVEYREQEDRWYFRNEPLTIFAGVDLATSEKAQADDFACVIIGVTPTMKVVVMDVLSGHFDPGDQAGLISEQYLNWLPERVVIEDNGGQKYLVTEVKRWHNTHKGHPLIPVKAVTNTGEKYQRIIRMAPFVENGGLYMRMALDGEPGFRDQDREHVRDIRIHKKMEKLYYQLVELTPAIAHEDVADALDMAVSVGARNGRFLDDWANSILNDTSS